MIEFMATDDQIKQIAANAVMASEPVGLGRVHYDPYRKYKPTEFKITPRGLFLDYIGGRMVKLNIHRKTEKDMWEIDDRIDPEYQSWCDKYPTVLDLIESAGGMVI